jgi:hypothetical protein
MICKTTPNSFDWPEPSRRKETELMSKQHVLIKVSGGAITVTPSNVWGSKSKKDEIVWQCEQAFAIDFIPVGPFSKDHFESAPSRGLNFRKRKGFEVKQEADSGPIDPAAAPGDYKYTVTSGDITLDPVVHIDR